MAINLGNDFETAVAALAGIDMDTVDPGTLRIDLINPAGPTTIRFTVHVNVDTTELREAVRTAVVDP